MMIGSPLSLSALSLNIYVSATLTSVRYTLANIMEVFKSSSISIASAIFFIASSVLPADPEGLKSNTALTASTRYSMFNSSASALSETAILSSK